MGYKIKNIRYAGKSITIGREKVSFDENGVTELEVEHNFNVVITLPHFSAFEEGEKVVYGPVQAPVGDNKEDEKDEEEVSKEQEPIKPVAEFAPELLVHVTDEDTVKELDERADALRFVVTGNKKEKINAINKHIDSILKKQEQE